MDFFNQFNLKQLGVLKLVGLGFAALVVLAFVVRLIGGSFLMMPSLNRLGVSSSGITSGAYPAVDGYGKGGMPASAPMMAELSVRNVAPPSPRPQGSVGADAEAFEVTRYHATIRTRAFNETCEKIAAWKKQSHIVFEQAEEARYRCDYTFKVERARAGEVLEAVKALDPQDLSETIQTIKRQIDDFTSEKEILEKKRTSIEKTLEDAIRSYEEIATIATRSQDAASLAKIIESKLLIIERLTNERIAINEQLERLARAKEQQLDQVNYTYFSLNVFESAFVDTQALKDSWKEAVQEFVRGVNRVFQDVTINLVVLAFFIAQYVLYFFIAVVVVKYVWQMTKYIWKK